ncbi:hypothetical protein SDC9_203884 [bioreactor metagenome]|uniref:Uncharacterized protein n=1 Tax=bioreactor metagenome TaxID=1076179 RepID=A0A645IXQ7_9ZZZZ
MTLDGAKQLHVCDREIPAQRQNRVQPRRAVSLREHETVAVGILRFLRVDIHRVEIQDGQRVDYRQRASDVTGRRGVHRVHCQQSCLRGVYREGFYLIFIHAILPFGSIHYNILYCEGSRGPLRSALQT